MSRIGKKIIPIPKGVKIDVKPGVVEVQGPKGKMTQPLPPGIGFELDGDQLSAKTLREDEWVVKLPPGTRAIAVPTAKTVDTPFGVVSIAVEQTPGKVTVKSSLLFKKSRITPAEDPAWRSFCEAVDRAFGQRIVVGK